MKEKSKNENLGIEVLGDASVPSARTKVIINASEKLYLDSLSVGREFAKHMITLSSGAIGTYLVLLKFIKVDAKIPLDNFTIILFVPPIFYLFAMLLFGLSFIPKNMTFYYGFVNETERAITKNTQKRRFINILAFLAFLLATLLFIFTFILLLTKESF